MGKVVTLREIVGTLGSLDPELTIYAREPWSPDSDAMAEREPEHGGTPGEYGSAGMVYFLEVSIAQDVLHSWKASQPRPPSLEEQCRRLVQYALYDA